MKITFGEWEKTDSYGGKHARAVFADRFPGKDFDPSIVAMNIEITGKYGIYGRPNIKGDDTIVRVGRHDYATEGDDI